MLEAIPPCMLASLSPRAAERQLDTLPAKAALSDHLIAMARCELAHAQKNETSTDRAARLLRHPSVRGTRESIRYMDRIHAFQELVEEGLLTSGQNHVNMRRMLHETLRLPASERLPLVYELAHMLVCNGYSSETLRGMNVRDGADLLALIERERTASGKGALPRGYTQSLRRHFACNEARASVPDKVGAWLKCVSSLAAALRNVRDATASAKDDATKESTKESKEDFEQAIEEGAKRSDEPTAQEDV